MALTLKGNRTGAAARLTQEDADNNLMALMSHEKYCKEKIGELMDELKRLDPAGWEAWFEACVPEWKGWGTPGYDKAYGIIQRHIAELEHEAWERDTRQTLESVRPF